MQCRICGSNGAHRHYVAKEMMLGLRDEHRYFQCAGCDCLQIEHIPANIADYYPDNYYSYSDATKAGNPVKQALTKLRDRYEVTGKCLIGRVMHFWMPNAKLATLRPLHLTQASQVLDVGCGAGHLLHSLRELGFHNLLGIDPFNQADIAYPNGLRVEKRDIFSEQGQWDAVMFHHSFEHLPNQRTNLGQAFNILKPGGMALVRIPTVSSYVWQEYGVNWVQLDAPRHLYLHSVKSMQALAEQAGFITEKVVFDSNALQFWGSKQYEQDIPLRDPRSWAESPEHLLFTAKEMREFEQRSRELNAINQGDQAAFYLRKPA
ncbi:class I SAM-dependent methyltransferase [Thiothrix fructosivorans]|jgi:2-polyprenyl-3-methyl-5-hydroxy-6-metoxy-1,4-benzoquinol methylase|uniref:Class I SAM-dependent methyltransferase n=1 Tax=Thiothrix fructosivorans TaxID=111770 RepID=A0A8B0SER7_9GAMM|nr:class I SAM-dependent methyltransferase [Thiothrix fructosivorans]MBO0611812.1 class I SAM-dependent methyltransferase [Thiothrix fructosivorans]QTX10533.1 class I SAM-dependent methyltransferase [Thiothrix fructosivorans]